MNKFISVRAVLSHLLWFCIYQTLLFGKRMRNKRMRVFCALPDDYLCTRQLLARGNVTERSPVSFLLFSNACILW